MLETRDFWQTRARRVKENLQTRETQLYTLLSTAIHKHTHTGKRMRTTKVVHRNILLNISFLLVQSDEDGEIHGSTAEESDDVEDSEHMTHI